MKRSNQFVAIAISLVLHAAVLAPLLLSDSPVLPREEDKVPTVVELLESFPSQPATLGADRQHKQAHGRANSSRASKTAATLPGLQELKSDFKFGRFAPNARKAQAGDESLVTDGQAFDDPRSYRLSSETYVEGMNNHGFLEAVFNRVNGFVIFDSLLAQYGHFGTVYAEFILDHRGILRAESVRAHADDGILRVHSLRALRFSLSAPLAQSYWLSEGKTMRMRIRFQYLQGGSTLFDENPEKVAGLAVTIRRRTGERPVARSLGQQLLGGGIQVDPFAMYEKWEKYLKARERQRFATDPFADYRVDPDFAG